MKGQVSLEFLLIVSSVLFFLFVFFSAAVSTQLSAQGEQTQRLLSNVCSDVSDKINKAVFYGLGFSQNITLPQTLYGTDYSITVRNNWTLECVTSTASVINIFTNTSIKNSTAYPPFIIPKRQIRISNTGGVVLIT